MNEMNVFSISLIFLYKVTNSIF